jgi:ligand-binding SRPBCC domain-containing protein
MYQYKTEQWLPVTLEKAWDFFSSPHNLAKITPPELDFQLLPPYTDREIYEGMKIDYMLKPVLGIPVHWQTEICSVEKNKFFTDIQVKGPYKIWEHTHHFSEQNGGVLMKDVINYELPLSLLGNIAHWLFVKNKIKRIFSYRETTLNKIFSSS